MDFTIYTRHRIEPLAKHIRHASQMAFNEFPFQSLDKTSNMLEMYYTNTHILDACHTTFTTNFQRNYNFARNLFMFFFYSFTYSFRCLRTCRLKPSDNYL